MFEVSKNEIVDRLKFDNPWWEESSQTPVPFHDKPRRRYFPQLYAAISNKDVRRAVVLMGPRRVGKTVIVYQVINKLISEGVDRSRILYLSLETPIYTGLSLEQLLGYFVEIFQHGRGDGLYVFFDEVQYLKHWETHLKSLVDSFKEYKFTVTGSAAAALRMKSNESGAGRFTDFILPPLTFAEYLYFVGKESDLISIESDDDERHYSTKNINLLNSEFIDYLNLGGYPEAVFSKAIRDDPAQYIKSDIIDKVLLRDLPSLYGISDIQELNKLFTTIAYNSGGEFSLENLSKSAGIAKNTIRRYLEYLEAAFLIRRVDRIDNNARRFKRAVCFKIYLTNPSMRAALFGRLNERSSAMGQMAETAIFSQWQHSKVANLYYARWPKGEIDIVRLGDAEQSPDWAVEVKWSDRMDVARSELDSCVEFCNAHPDMSSPMLVTTKTIDKRLDYKGVSFELRPSSLYAYILGANILRALHRIHPMQDT